MSRKMAPYKRPSGPVEGIIDNKGRHTHMLDMMPHHTLLAVQKHGFMLYISS